MDASGKKLERLLIFANFQLLAILILVAILVSRSPNSATDKPADKVEPQNNSAQVKALQEQLETSQASSRQSAANTNARSLATAVQAKAIATNQYDPNLADYASDMGGSIPVNPCTGTDAGYVITVKGQTATVTAEKGVICGEWAPMTFSLTL